MSNTSIWVIIIGVSVVSLLPRILPVALFSRFEFPPFVKKWLSFVAPAVLGALTALSVFAPGDKIDLSIHNHYIWAFLPTLAAAIKTKSLFYTLLIGILAMAIIYNLAPGA